MRNDSSSQSESGFNTRQVSDGITYDPDTIVIQSTFGDEISAHRAKKLWSDTLANFFMLQVNDDYVCTIIPIEDIQAYYLACTFLSPNGRYAFWRITNYQAPEAQYIFETAHIPLCESRHADILKAPDLRSVYEDPIFLRVNQTSAETKATISAAFKKILDSLLK